ncbi:hypothetical protein BJ508DRAFT_152993, partial [Ascobolus immersus RN42]
QAYKKVHWKNIDVAASISSVPYRINFNCLPNSAGMGNKQPSLFLTLFFLAAFLTTVALSQRFTGELEPTYAPGSVLFISQPNSSTTVIAGDKTTIEWYQGRNYDGPIQLLLRRVDQASSEDEDNNPIQIDETRARNSPSFWVPPTNIEEGYYQLILRDLLPDTQNYSNNLNAASEVFDIKKNPSEENESTTRSGTVAPSTAIPSTGSDIAATSPSAARATKAGPSPAVLGAAIGGSLVSLLALLALALLLFKRRRAKRDVVVAAAMSGGGFVEKKVVNAPVMQGTQELDGTVSEIPRAYEMESTSVPPVELPTTR